MYPNNHIHLCEAPGSVEFGEELRVQAFSPMTTITQNTVLNTAGKRIIMVAGNSTPIKHTDYHYKVRVSKTQLEVLRGMVGKAIYVQNMYHLDDENHEPVDAWEYYFFGAMENESIMNPMGVWYMVDITLIRLEPDAS